MQGREAVREPEKAMVWMEAAGGEARAAVVDTVLQAPTRELWCAAGWSTVVWATGRRRWAVEAVEEAEEVHEALKSRRCAGESGGEAGGVQARGGVVAVHGRLRLAASRAARGRRGEAEEEAAVEAGEQL